MNIQRLLTAKLRFVVLDERSTHCGERNFEVGIHGGYSRERDRQSGPSQFHDTRTT